ncbi:MAG: redox-regulated ATPase YchF [Acidimicrobiia bacterium]|nr:redox-regulated ATPase YchF [Acidimicrobiia bacterium]
MALRAGIVGLPNVGKSTLFNALTAASVEAANYPFATIEPNVGVVPVPDDRLGQINSVIETKEIIPAVVEILDIAGLVRGASEGEGLGNQFLGNIRDVDAVIEVVRCFGDPDVTHVDGSIDPVRDIETIETELIMADLQVAERHLDRVGRAAKSGAPELVAQHRVLDKIVSGLSEGKPVRTLELSTEERKSVRDIRMLTEHPVLYVCNVDEEGIGGNDHTRAVSAAASETEAGVITLCAAAEAEISQLETEDRQPFLDELGLEEPGLHALARATYRLLGLTTFFTAGPKEIRAWTVRSGATAPQAAGMIHSDFEAGFIRAEVYTIPDLLEAGSEVALKAAGRLRVEGKDYIVKDGDVLHFRFNV